jgi:hypothetical protein
MKILIVLGLLALGATGLMADKCEFNIPWNTDTTTTPPQ